MIVILANQLRKLITLLSSHQIVTRQKGNKKFTIYDEDTEYPERITIVESFCLVSTAALPDCGWWCRCHIGGCQVTVTAILSSCCTTPHWAVLATSNLSHNVT